MVAVFAEKFWGGFCRALGRPELEADPRFHTNDRRLANKALLAPLPTLGTPITVDGALGLDVRPASVPGEHTGEVLTGLLGYTADRVQRLRDQGVSA